jgi:hypothetical protein
MKDEASFDRNRPWVQKIHFSVAATELPIYTDLFGVCNGSAEQAWCLEG